MKPYIAVYTQKPESAAILLAVLATTHPDFNCADRRDDDSNLAEMMAASVKAADGDHDVHMREYDEVGEVPDVLDLDDVGTTMIETESHTVAAFLLKKMMTEAMFELTKDCEIYTFSLPESRVANVQSLYCADLEEDTDYTIYQR